MRLGRWKCLGVVGATLPLWIPAFAGMTRWVVGMTISGARMTAFLAGRPGGIYGGAGAGYSGR